MRGAWNGVNRGTGTSKGSAASSMTVYRLCSGVLHVGISEHSLIYAIQKVNAKPVTESRDYIKITSFRKYKPLNDLYGVPWDEMRNKSDVDGMWEIKNTVC